MEHGPSEAYLTDANEGRWHHAIRLKRLGHILSHLRRHDRQTTHLFSPAQSHIAYKVLRPARCSNTDSVLLNKDN
ncbi:hypothetical protein IG631_18177 [Alternaria alternata]|nr:hypothetical protein IG631_18177 [Alternaria alternata]